MTVFLWNSVKTRKKSLFSHLMNVGFVSMQKHIFFHLIKEQPEKVNWFLCVWCTTLLWLMWDIIYSHSHSLWFFNIRSFGIVLHRCERFSFSNVNLFLLVFSSSSFGTTAPSISVIPFAISECHLYMSLADSTVLITSEYISLVLDRIATTTIHKWSFYFAQLNYFDLFSFIESTTQIQ